MPGDPGAGPAMPKPTSASVERFRRVVPANPAVSLRPMFGNLAAFANGYLFAGLFGDDVFIRIDDAGQAAITTLGGRPFAPMPGRPMRGYVVLPDAWSDDESELRIRLEAGLAYTLALPPKPPKVKLSRGGGSS